jgi:hypothetical protein
VAIPARTRLAFRISSHLHQYKLPPATGSRFLVINLKTRIMKKRFSEWMDRNNMVFSVLAGETFTNREVVYTHIGLVLFVALVGFVGNF